VGNDRLRIVAAATHLLEEAGAYQRMARAVNPYGDGLLGVPDKDRLPPPACSRQAHARWGPAARAAAPHARRDSRPACSRQAAPRSGTTRASARGASTVCDALNVQRSKRRWQSDVRVYPGSSLPWVRPPFTCRKRCPPNPHRQEISVDLLARLLRQTPFPKERIDRWMERMATRSSH